MGQRIIFRPADNESHCPVDSRRGVVCMLSSFQRIKSVFKQTIFFHPIHSTYSGKTLRRTTLMIGLLSLALLAFQTGWETSQIINAKKTAPFEELLRSFNENSLLDSSLWFNALVQVLFSTNIGIGVLPVLTGKFLYKGDAVR